jgi:gliding motility-associated-like protein
MVINLKNTAWFRVVVQGVSEPESYSAPASISVWPEAKAGSITGATNVCKGSNSGEVTLSGQTGTVKRWEYSVDNSFWVTIPSSSGLVTYSYSNIDRKTWYRAVVQSGTGCSEVTTASIAIDVDEPTNPGVVAGANTVCKGLNSGSVVLSGNTGSVVRWEASATGLSPWMSITETASTLGYTNLVNSTWYRSVVKSGTCPESASNSIAITVNELSVGGITSGIASVCSENNSGEVSVSGYLGSIALWQYSVNDGTSWRDTAVTQATLGYENITQSRIYRASVKNGVCESIVSSQTKITVNPLPVVAFTAVSKPEGEAITFTNSSTVSSGSIQQYFWDFGDGSSSTARSPIHTYENSGDYEVRLEATSDKGCTDSLKKDIEVYEVPNVDFVFTNICLKNEAQFTNTSAVAYSSPSYSWNFGDGSPVSNDENPGHRYSTSGKYIVTLTVATPFSTASQSKTIEVYYQATPRFEATSSCLGSSMVFLNKSSIIEGYLSYSWSFGDSKSSTELNPTHTYGTTGIFTVRLITTSNNNCLDTIYNDVYVNPVPQAAFTAVDAPFGEPILFTNSSLISSGTFTNTWDLGDGSSSTDTNPQHTYSSAGNYLVELSLQSDSGCVATQSKTVWVFPNPHAAFTALPVCVYDSVSFENQSTISSGSMTYFWKFGDGNTSIKSSPEWRYSNPGTYTVTLIATSDKLGVDSTTRTIDIHPQPTPDFITQNVCDGFPMEFQDNSVISKGSIVGYLWDFGDGSNAIRQSPTRQYLNPGNYIVSLLVTSDKSCTASVSKNVVVYDNPVASFTIASVCHEQTVSPINLSQAGNNSNYLWDMGDGIAINGFNASHEYSSPGFYSVKLKVTDLNECADSLERSVNIYSLPNLEVGNDTSIVLGYSVQIFAYGATNFEWYPAEGLSSAFVQNPIASPNVTTTYYLTAQDQNGCINQDSIIIRVEDNHIIIATNILTPDGNGQNDTWSIRNIENYSDAEVTILNRWGTIVYHTTNYQNDWNGTNSNNDILPDGTYYYVITMPNTPKVYKGAVTILRNK